MGESTGIGWCRHTFNPWHGCERVSEGCRFCYAEAFSLRIGQRIWGADADRRFFGDAHWSEPLKWARQAEAAGEAHLVFCASMADVFEDREDLVEQRARLWKLVEATGPWLVWLLLTKRPENVRRMVPLEWLAGGWPGHVWVGTTVETQERADERVPLLRQIPAPVRFLSCEPLLGPVRLAPEWLGPQMTVCGRGRDLTVGDVRALAEIGRRAGQRLGGQYVDWIIVGGESGPRHRALDLGHARALVGQARWASVPVFFKQVGGRTPKAGGDLLDGVRVQEFPRPFVDAPVAVLADA